MTESGEHVGETEVNAPCGKCRLWPCRCLTDTELAAELEWLARKGGTIVNDTDAPITVRVPSGVAADRYLADVPGYPSGDRERDRVIELLCDEWPVELCLLDLTEWDNRLRHVMRLLDVLDRNRLTVIDLGDPVGPDELRELLRGYRAVRDRMDAGEFDED